MARLLEAIFKGKALNNESNEQFIKQLKTLKKDSYISDELPAGVDVADKPWKFGRCANGFRNRLREEPAVRDQCDDFLQPGRARGRARDQ